MAPLLRRGSRGTRESSPAATHTPPTTPPPAAGTAALHAIVESVWPRAILLLHSSQGFDLAPALAVAFDAPLVTNCVALVFDGPVLVATRKILNDKVVVETDGSGERPYLAT